MNARRELLTVGHSTHSIDAFLALLGGAGIEAVIDVRRFPGSRRYPQFGRDSLAASLPEADLRYESLPQLGGRRRVVPGSPNDAWRVEAFRGYADHLRSEEFADGLERLRAIACERRATVMCAEAQWWRCHRRLIADVLTFDDWNVHHLMPDGRLVEHEPPEFATRADDGLPIYPATPQEPLFGG